MSQVFTHFIVGIFLLFFGRNYNQRDEKKSSGKEMRLVIVVGLLAVTVIALIVALTLQMAVFRKEQYKEMCQSEECIKTGIFYRYPVIFSRNKNQINFRFEGKCQDNLSRSNYNYFALRCKVVSR